MQKEELLHLHMLMIQVKKYYEYVNHTTIPTDEYDTLGTTPLHIHKSKNIHCVALMTLGNEVVTHMRETCPELAAVVAARKAAAAAAAAAEEDEEKLKATVATV